MITNNWCGLSPYFYNKENPNEVSKKLSTKEVVAYDEIGLNLYLNAGYCLFGRTPYQGYSFLRANETLNEGKVTNRNVDYLTNLVKSDSVSVETTIQSIANRIHEIEKLSSEKIIIPLSGGMDSRLLLSLIEDKSRIEAFTYGQSWTQSKSNEVTKARALSKKMNFKWQHIEIRDYSNLMPLWIEKWGAASHAHGMYQMQFYAKIASLVPSNSVVLSGIIGDLLAGSLPTHSIRQPSQLFNLALSREMNAKSVAEKLAFFEQSTSIEDFLESEFATYESVLRHKRAADLVTIQNKNMLLRYLVEVPEWYGFNSQSPYLDECVGTNMLRLADELRQDRQWQKSYLEDIRLGDSYLGRPGLFSNTLNFGEIYRGNIELQSIDGLDLLSGRNEIRREMNRQFNALRSYKYRVIQIMAETYFFKTIARIIFRVYRKEINKALVSYFSYLTLAPLVTKGKR